MRGAAGQAQEMEPEAGKERLEWRLNEWDERLERERRADKRQAAPFSKGTSAANGRRPGRHAGGGVWGTGLPTGAAAGGSGSGGDAAKAACGGRSAPSAGRSSIRRSCYSPGRLSPAPTLPSVWGPHPEQTSDALAVAAVQLGPRAVALVT